MPTAATVKPPSLCFAIETPQGISDDGAQRISYRSGIDEVESIEASTVKPDGTEIKVPESAIRTQDEDSDGGATEFSDTKYKVIVFPAVEVGGRVRYKVTINHRTTPFPKFFNDFYRIPAAMEMGILGGATSTCRPVCRSLSSSVGSPAASSRPRTASITTVLATADRKLKPPKAAVCGMGDYAPILYVSTYPDMIAVGKAYAEAAAPDGEDYGSASNRLPTK